MNNNYDFKGKEYRFKLGVIDDEMVEECRGFLKEYCKNMVEYEEIGKNTIGYSIGIGEKEIDDELLFQSAIAHYKEYLRKQLDERNSHTIYASEIHEYD